MGQPRPQGHLWSCSRWTAVWRSDLEGTGRFCHLIGWWENKRFLLIIMIMQPWYQVNRQERSTVWRNNKDGRALFIKHLPRLSDRKQQAKSEWSCGSAHKTKLRKTVNVNRNMNIQSGRRPAETHLMVTMLTNQFLDKAMIAASAVIPVNENSYCLSWGPVHTLLTMIWEQNKIITDRLPVHTVTSSVCMSTSGPMLITFDQPLFELFTLLLCDQSQLFKVETYCSRTGAYCYGVKTYYNQQ